MERTFHCKQRTGEIKHTTTAARGQRQAEQRAHPLSQATKGKLRRAHIVYGGSSNRGLTLANLPPPFGPTKQNSDRGIARRPSPPGNALRGTQAASGISPVRTTDRVTPDVSLAAPAAPSPAQRAQHRAHLGAPTLPPDRERECGSFAERSRARAGREGRGAGRTFTTQAGGGGEGPGREGGGEEGDGEARLS